jgi:hypothetical protein
MASSLKRLPDWMRRLDTFLAESNGRKFEYGQWDCFLFACAAIEAQTGVNPGDELRGKYDSAAGSRRQMAAVCGKRSFGEAVAAVFARYGIPEFVNPSDARRGDAVLVKRGRGRYSVGLAAGDGIYTFNLLDSGIVALPRLPIVHAWRVG